MSKIFTKLANNVTRNSKKKHSVTPQDTKNQAYPCLERILNQTQKSEYTLNELIQHHYTVTHGQWKLCPADSFGLFLCHKFAMPSILSIAISPQINK